MGMGVVKDIPKSEAKKLFLTVMGDLNAKGLSVKRLPKGYPISLGTIYRLKGGKASDKTINKIKKLQYNVT